MIIPSFGIQILSFSGEKILNHKWLSNLPMKEKTITPNCNFRQSLGGGGMGEGVCYLSLPKLPRKPKAMAKKAPGSLLYLGNIFAVFDPPDE